MAISTIGGRDYYTNAVEVTNDGTYADIPSNTKAIFFVTGDDYVLKFDNGVELTLSPDDQQITNLIPDQIKVHDSTNRQIIYLF